MHHTDTYIHRYTYRCVYYAQLNIYMHMHTETYLHIQIHTYRYIYYAQINTYTQIHAHTPHMLPSPVPLSWGPAIPLQAEALIQGGCGAQAQVWGFRDALPAPKGSQVKGPWPLDWRPQFWLWGWGHSGQFFPLWPPVGPSDCSLAPLGPHALLCQTRGWWWSQGLPVSTSNEEEARPFVGAPHSQHPPPQPPGLLAARSTVGIPAFAWSLI